MAANDVTTLTETAIKYQKDLRYLPFAVLAAELGLLGIKLYPGIQNKHVLTNYLRSAGIARPYLQGTVEDSQLGKAEEKTLETHLAYANVKDNIQNYKTITVGPDVLLGKNRSKRHPWQMLMLTSIIKTFSEDVLDALFHAIRNTGTRTPMGLFNGYNKLMDDAIAGGDVADANGNYFSTGAITTANAYEQLEGMYKALHPLLRKANTIMVMPYHIADKYDARFFELYKYKPVMDAHGRASIMASNGKCKIVRTPYQGGSRVYITLPGNFHFGMDNMSDADFVSVRQPFIDPNDVQFWIQAAYGTRIQTWHKKAFMVNDQADASVAYSGDFTS